MERIINSNGKVKEYSADTFRWIKNLHIIMSRITVKNILVYIFKILIFKKYYFLFLYFL